MRRGMKVSRATAGVMATGLVLALAMTCAWVRLRSSYGRRAGDRASGTIVLDTYGCGGCTASWRRRADER